MNSAIYVCEGRGHIKTLQYCDGLLGWVRGGGGLKGSGGYGGGGGWRKRAEQMGGAKNTRILGLMVAYLLRVIVMWALHCISMLCQDMPKMQMWSKVNKWCSLLWHLWREFNRRPSDLWTHDRTTAPRERRRPLGEDYGPWCFVINTTLV